MTEYPAYFLKYLRAVEHYETIHTELGRFVKCDLSSTTRHFKGKGGQEWIAVEWDRVGRLDPMCQVWLGDLLHNLHGCLDYVANELVLEQGHKPRDVTEFPIYWHQDEWARNVARRHEFSWKRLRRRHPSRPNPIAGVKDPQLTTIEAAQPYHSPEKDRARHPLALLKRMSVIDKHRTLHAAAVTLRDQAAIAFDPPGVLLTDGFKYPRGRPAVEKSAEVVHFRYRTPGMVTPPYPNVNVEVRGIVQLAFGPPDQKSTCTLPDIVDTLQYVRILVATLRPRAYELQYPGRKRLFPNPDELQERPGVTVNGDI